MTDSRLSVCPHVCCESPKNWGHDEPLHLHLFPPSQCPDCVAESKLRHPTHGGKL